MEEYEAFIEENRAHWDELADHHPETEYYDVEAFLEGESSLRQLERAELDVADKRLLHLQCHFGLDTLSWVRDEDVAHATGVDFSETAIELARELRETIGLGPDRVRFVQSNVYELPDHLDDSFEVVFTSYGTIYWLPDLERWAEVIAHHLEEDGTFYIVDGHPFGGPFHYDSTADDLQVAHPYFNTEPITEVFDGSYAGWEFDLEHRRSHGFNHSMESIISALVGAGLEIEFLHEFPWSFFQRFHAMEADEDDRWRLPGLEHELPFTFSLQARLTE